MSNNIYYTYAYLDPRKPGNFTYGNYQFNYEPFYIGKGHTYRDKMHLWKNGCTNRVMKGKINHIREQLNCEPIVLRIKDNLSEEEAFSLEVELIKQIGRIITDNGPLTNHLEGGQTGKGPKRGPQNPELLARLTKMRRENPPRLGKSNSTNQKNIVSKLFKGKAKSEEHKKNMSVAAIARANSQGWKDNIRKVVENKPKTIRVKDLEGNIIGEYVNLTHASRYLTFWNEGVRKGLKKENVFTTRKYVFEKIL